MAYHHGYQVFKCKCPKCGEKFEHYACRLTGKKMCEACDRKLKCERKKMQNVRQREQLRG